MLVRMPPGEPEVAMGTVDFDVFDADNHYYEATDAFIRHLPTRSLEARAVGRDRRQAADDRRQQDLPLHPEPHVRPGRAAGLPRRLLPRQGRPATTSAPRSASSSRSTPRTASPTARVKLMDTQGMRRLLPVPDARRRRGRGAAARSRRAARRVPRVQRVDARRLDLQLRRPHLRRAVHRAAGPGAGRAGGRRTRSSTARTSS